MIARRRGIDAFAASQKGLLLTQRREGAKRFRDLPRSSLHHPQA